MLDAALTARNKIAEFARMEARMAREDNDMITMKIRHADAVAFADACADIHDIIDELALTISFFSSVQAEAERVSIGDGMAACLSLCERGLRAVQAGECAVLDSGAERLRHAVRFPNI